MRRAKRIGNITNLRGYPGRAVASFVTAKLGAIQAAADSPNVPTERKSVLAEFYLPNVPTERHSVFWVIAVCQTFLRNVTAGFGLFYLPNVPSEHDSGFWVIATYQTFLRNVTAGLVSYKATSPNLI